MNPNNKIIIPLPNKPSKKDPYERVQSAPPDGKEEDKIRDMNIKEAFKNWQVNPGQKQMNINSKEFLQKIYPLPLQEFPKKQKQATPLNLNSSEFKNFNENEKKNANPTELTLPKPHPQTALNEKLNENKKKMSLKSTSKPFTLNTMNGPTVHPEQKLQANLNNNNITDVLITNRPEQPTHGALNTPTMNFGDSGSSSFPKLTNKNKLKPPIPTTNSSNELEKTQKDQNHHQNIQKSGFIPNEKTNDNSKLENKTQKIFNPIVEEKTQKEEKKSPSFKTPSSTLNNNKNDAVIAPIKTDEKNEVKSPIIPKAQEKEMKQKEKHEEITKKEKETIIPTETSKSQMPKEETVPRPCYKEFMMSVINLGRQTRLNNPPSNISMFLKREVMIESFQKKQYNNHYKQQNRNRNENQQHITHEKDDFTIERSQNISQNESPENLFSREPDDKKKKELKDQLYKWTKHFKEIGKEESIKLQNSIRMNLNILTPDNFSKIKLVLVDLVKNNNENLNLLVDKIIEKAWNEPKYIKTYADLCSFLQDEKSLQEKCEEGKKGKNKSLFKSLLLGRIQTAFEKQEFLKQKYDEEQAGEKNEISKKKKKKNVFGNMKFIGELYICKVIPQKVIIVCVLSMISKFLEDFSKAMAANKNDVEVESYDFEDNLEAILILLDHVGKVYEKERGDKEKKKDSNHSENEKKLVMNIKKMVLEINKNKFPSETDLSEIRKDTNDLSVDSLFDVLKFFQEEIPLLSCRLKLLTLNLCERKQEGWKDKLFSNEGPKKIAELHEEIKKEQEEIYKSAMEYKEKYQYETHNKNIQKVYQQKQAPRVQVAVEKTQKDEEKKEIDSSQNPNYKVKLAFSLNRDAPAKNNKESKLSPDEVKGKIKEIFNFLRNENNKEQTFEDLVKLSQKCSNKILFSSFFNEYYNDKIAEVEKRLDLPFRLVKEKAVNKEDFIKEFNDFLNTCWEIASDIPFLVTSLAKIFVFFVKNQISSYSEIEITKSDDFEDVMYFIQDFVEANYKLLKEENLKEEHEKELNDFVKRSEIDNEGTWYNRMKSKC